MYVSWLGTRYAAEKTEKEYAENMVVEENFQNMVL